MLLHIEPSATVFGLLYSVSEVCMELMYGTTQLLGMRFDARENQK